MAAGLRVARFALLIKMKRGRLAPLLVQKWRLGPPACHNPAPCTLPPPPAHAQIKPPLCFSEAQADRMVAALRCALLDLSADGSELARLVRDSAREVAEIDERHARLG